MHEEPTTVKKQRDTGGMSMINVEEPVENIKARADEHFSMSQY